MVMSCARFGQSREAARQASGFGQSAPANAIHADHLDLKSVWQCIESVGSLNRE